VSQDVGDAAFAEQNKDTVSLAPIGGPCCEPMSTLPTVGRYSATVALPSHATLLAKRPASLQPRAASAIEPERPSRN
jgi:hypothetical protein